MNGEGPAPVAGAVATVFRCGTAALWLPRVLASSVLVGGYLVARRVDPDSVIHLSSGFRLVLVVFAAVAAVWVVRRGGELRRRVGLTADAVEFSAGRHRFRLPLSDVDGLRYDAPFAATRNWLPAATLIDRDGRAWRLPTLLEGGDRLIAALVERTGRQDLATWAEVLALEARMRRGPRFLVLGYATAALIAAAGLAYGLH